MTPPPVFPAGGRDYHLRGAEWPMDEMTETKELLKCKSQKDRENLLAYIFIQYRERLKTMVRLRLDTRLQGRIDPSDVIQEAYLEASSRLGEFLREPAVPVFVWLRFLTSQKLQELHRHHLCVKRRDARREISLYHEPLPQASSEALAAQLLGQDTSPSETAARAENIARLREALESMDARDREVIALRHFEGLSSAETARVLGIREGAGSKRYVRALERLKEILTRLNASGDAP